MYTIRTNSLLTVTIEVVPDPPPPGAHLVYVPGTLHAHRGDTILWRCQDGPFAIQFLRGAPLGRVHYHSDGNGLGPIPVPPGAPNGCHRYAVAVYKEGVVYIDAECPEIIID